MILAAGGSATLLIELGLLLLALAVTGRLAHRLSISPIPFYLLIGLAVNPGGWFPLDASEGFIQTGAAFGVVLLLFTLGLEYSPDELVSGLRSNAPSGVVDGVLNFLPGLGAGFLLGWDWQAALLLGGVTYISSSGIIAKLLDDLGRTGNRETGVILSILVIEDLVMAFYLPVIGGILSEGGPTDTVVSVALAVSAAAVVLVAALRYGARVTRAMETPSSEVLLFSVLGLTLLVGGLAESLQVSAAVGAFLVGVAVSGPTAHRLEPLVRPLRDLFAAAFFVFFALEIDFGSVTSMLVPAVLLATVTAGTKVATGWWAARRAGIGKRGRRRAGATLIARGEFSIVIAGIGVAAGVTGELGGITAGYVLILAVVGPVAARFTD